MFCVSSYREMEGDVRLSCCGFLLIFFTSQVFPCEIRLQFYHDPSKQDGSEVGNREMGGR